MAPDADRFFDGGTDTDPPDPTAPPRIVLERVEVGDLQRRTERFRMQRRIAYRDREYGELLVPAAIDAFDTDLTSVPTIFTWLVPRTGRHQPPALLHDGLVHGPEEPASYLSSEGHVLDRVAADRVFRDAMNDTDTGPVRSRLIWSAVTLATIWSGSATWSRTRHLRYRVAPSDETVSLDYASVEPDRRADVAHGRRIAMLRRMALDEVEDLLLALGQIEIHGAGSLTGVTWRLGANICSHKLRDLSDGSQGGAATRPILAIALRRWRNW